MAKRPVGEAPGLVLQCLDRLGHDARHEGACDQTGQKQPDGRVGQSPDGCNHGLPEVVLRDSAQNRPLPCREGRAGPHHAVPLFTGPGQQSGIAFPNLRGDLDISAGGKHLADRPIRRRHGAPRWLQQQRAAQWLRCSWLGQVPLVEFGQVQAAHQDRLQGAAAIEYRDTEEDFGTPADLSHEANRELGSA